MNLATKSNYCAKNKHGCDGYIQYNKLATSTNNPAETAAQRYVRAMQNRQLGGTKIVRNHSVNRFGRTESSPHGAGSAMTNKF